MNYLKNSKIKNILFELIPYAILIVVGYYLLSTSIYNQNIPYLETINNFKISNLKIFFEALESEAEILKNDSLLLEYLKPFEASINNKNKYNQFKKDFENNLRQIDYEFSGTQILFMDQKGKILYVNSHDNTIKNDILGSSINNWGSHLKKSFEQGLKHLYIEDYSLIMSLNDYYYTLSFPVEDKKTKNKGVFIVLIPASKVNEVINTPISNYKTIHSYLVGKNYVLGTLTRDKSNYLINDNSILNSFKGNNDLDKITIKNYYGKKVLRRVDKFKFLNLDFLVATDVDYNEIFSPVYYYFVIALIFICSIIILRLKMYGDKSKHLADIQEHQSRFESIFEGSAIGISILDLEGKYISVNPLVQKSFNIDPKEIKKFSYKDITHPDYLDESVQGFNDLVNQKIAIWHGIQKVVMPRGEEVWVNLNRYLIKNKDGAPLYVISLAENITKEKQQEAALTEKEYKFSQLFNHLTTCLVVFQVEKEGREFVVKDINKMTEIYDPEIVVGKNIFELSTFFKAPEAYKTLKKVWETGSSEEKIISFLSQNQNNKWFDTCTFRLSNNEVVILFNDITTKVITEKMLHLTQNSLECADISTFWLTKDASIIQVNRKTCENLGYTKEELKELKIFDIDQIMKPQQWEDHWLQIKEKQVHKFESLHKKKDGTLIQVEITATSIIYDNNEYIFAYVNDLTEIRRKEKDLFEKQFDLENVVEEQTKQLKESLEKLEIANAELKSINSDKTSLINKLNHELRTPLSAITGFTGLLLEEYYGAVSEKQSQTLKVVNDSAEQLLSLLNEVFDSNIEDQKPDFEEDNEVKPVRQIKPRVKSSERPGKKILIAEDNAMNLQLVLDLLSIYNYEVLVARDGLEALELAQSEKPDLILMDIKMPFMDGDEVTRKLREMPEFSQTPIIALTAYAGKVAKNMCMEAGFTDYLDKPYPIQSLLNILNVHLSVEVN